MVFELVLRHHIVCLRPIAEVNKRARAFPRLSQAGGPEAHPMCRVQAPARDRGRPQLGGWAFMSFSGRFFNDNGAREGSDVGPARLIGGKPLSREIDVSLLGAGRRHWTTILPAQTPTHSGPATTSMRPALPTASKNNGVMERCCFTRRAQPDFLRA
jgi:hypothetical protein